MRLPAALVLASLLLLVALPPGALRADDEAPPEGPPPAEEAAPADAPEEEAPEEEAGARPLHKVYVPYRDLARIFEKEDEGVFLPYEEFLRLWKRAHRVETPDEGAPVAAVVREASYVGRVEDDVVVLEASLEIDVLEDGWQVVPLAFGHLGVERATIGESPALLLDGGDAGWRLALEGRGRRTLRLDLRVPATREGDRRVVRLTLPPVPLSRLSLAVPGGASEVAVEPRVAFRTRPEGESTRLEAFLGPVGSLRVGWQPKVEEEAAVAPLVFAETRHDVRVAPGVLGTETTIDLSVLRAPLERFVLAVPADAVTLYVQADGLRTWRRSPEGTRLELELREPLTEKGTVRLGLERPLPALPATVGLPLAGVEDVERETGFVRLLSGEGVKAEAVDTPGLRRIDQAELPEALRGGGRDAAWRFATRPGEVRVLVEALEPRVDIALGQRVTVRPEGTTLAALVALDVTRAGIFGLEVALPPDLEVSEVRVEGDVAYDDHKVREEDGRRVLEVAFRDRLLGKARLFLFGRRETPLAGPEAETTWTTLAAPLVTVPAAHHVRGTVELRVAPSVEHREEGREGLAPLDAGAPEVVALPPARGTPAPVARRYEHHSFPVGLSLGLRRRAPLVTAGVRMGVRLEPDRTRVDVVLDYDVRYRGVDTFRFTAPLSAADRLDLDLEGVQLLGPEPVEEEGREPTRGVWTVKLPADRMGSVPIVLEVEDVPEAPLASGDPPRRVVLPAFVPVEADGAPLPNVVHHVAVRRDPLLEVAFDAIERAEEIDPRELPEALRTDEDFLALRAYEPTWEAALLVTRHDYEPVAEVVVSHMHLDTVVQGDRATTEAWLVVRNNDRQNLALALPEGASIRALTVDGESRTPRRADGRVLVPLPSGLGKSEAFVVAVSFDHDVGRSQALHFETWSLKSPACENVTADLLTWRVFLPEDREVTRTGGTVDAVRPYRSWFAGLVGELFRTFGRRAQAAPIAVERAAAGFESPFAGRHEGQVMLFHNRVGTGTVAITAARPASNALFRSLFFALAVAGLLAFMIAARRIGLGEGLAFVAAVLVVLVLLVRAGPGAAGVLNAVFFGFLLAGAIRFAGHAVSAARARRAARPREVLVPPEAASEGGDDREAEAASDGGAKEDA